MILKLFKDITKTREERVGEAYRDLIRKEAKIGGEIFGAPRPGGRREFFCLDEHTWVWHEEWIDPVTKKRRVIMTRYDVRPQGVFKAQDGQPYQPLSPQEARNFYQAVETYEQKILHGMYQAA